MRARIAFTLIEVLVALALVGVTFAGLAALQVQGVKASSTARDSTQVKAEANRLLERLLETTTQVSGSGAALTDYAFAHYYVDCVLEPSGATISDFYPGSSSGDFDAVNCGGAGSDVAGFTPEARMSSTWSVNPVPGGGYASEGVMLLSVTTAMSNDGSPSITLGSAITCYDFFSGATAETPEPCPEPQ